MEENKVKRDKVLAISITVLALVVILGIGYAFFSASVSNANHETVSTQTATLSLKFDDGDNGISGNLNLGESITKKLTLQNTGTLDAYAKINWYNLVNTYMNGSLTYNLEQSESENGSYSSVGTGNVPVSSTETTETLKNGILVPVNTTYYYKLTITFNNLENINQNSDINAKFYSYFSLEEGSLSGADKIKNLVAGANTSSTDVITKESPAGSTCTNTLAYDGTIDNNLRYVGANPCNYVTFNGEMSTNRIYWTMIGEGDYATKTRGKFNSYEECEEERANWINGQSRYISCEKLPIEGGWRIVGVMNNVDDGTGKKETRIKLVRNDSLGYYSWDTSVSVNLGYGVNDWSQADLMQELNGDYLNTSLQANTMWYNGRDNKKTGEYDYMKGLKALAQSQIGNAKWYLGGVDDNISPYDATGAANNFYNYERGTEVWGSTSGQNCNDGACPRSTSWTGKVALIYPSDYGFAVGGEVRTTCLGKSLHDYSIDNCHTNNWFFNVVTTCYWTLTSGSDGNSSVFYISDGKGLFNTSFNAAASNEVYPAVYLKSDISITGGDGSPENPYTLG